MSSGRILNEAEAAATGSEPAQESETEQSIEVGAHERKKRGRKPLDPMLPREIVRHDTVAGGNAAANLYSLIETCKANSVEPYGYLVALFTALPLAQTADDYDALLPWRVTVSSD